MIGSGCWLVKSEADVYSIGDLEREGRTAWTGIRNFEARNLMRDRMREGDPVLFYHSKASPPGVAGLARVRGSAYPDPTQFDSGDEGHDPKATPDTPRWWLVDIEFVERFPRLVPLQDLRDDGRLSDMVLFRRLQLSVQPVTPQELEVVRELAGRTG